MPYNLKFFTKIVLKFIVVDVKAMSVQNIQPSNGI